MIPEIQASQATLEIVKVAWEDLCRKYAVDAGKCDRIWNKIQSSYSGPRRHYHNLHHIAQLLLFPNRYGMRGMDMERFRLAALFHDIVYRPFWGNSEKKSAKVCGRLLSDTGIPHELIQSTIRLILRTEKHDISGADKTELYFLDADLSILAAPEADYRAYTEAIRKEYRIFSDKRYYRGRLEAMRRFLKRKQIYLTADVHEDLESKARDNITREIEELRMKASS